MSRRKKITLSLLVLILIVSTYIVYFCPIKSIYTVNWENEEDGTASITYYSLGGLATVDTIVPISKPYYAEIIKHNTVNNGKGVEYITIVKINNKIYRYTDRNAYEYVKQFKDSTSHYKLEELFWPSHMYRTYNFNLEESE